jgi:hypothetical protein
MRGKLTVEKAASNMSIFFKAIDIVANEPNGTISRKDFGEIMGDFIGIESIKDGKENRTPYNKSKFPRYFGFLDLILINDIPHLKITIRGRRLHSCISDYGVYSKFDQRYNIKKESIYIVAELFWESILFDSFGRNNSGAEESHSDIDPVKVIIKSLIKLKSCTREELCFIIFGLNEEINSNSNEFNSIDTAISKIQENRDIVDFKYERYFQKWGKHNIVNDFKLLNILSDENVRVLISEDDKFQIDMRFATSYYEQAKSNYFSPYYRVTNELISYDGNEKKNFDWIREVRLGGIIDENIFIYDGGNSNNTLVNQGSKIGKLETALIKCFEEPKTNIYLLIINMSDLLIEDSLSDAKNLLERVNDFKDNYNGFSLNRLPMTNSLTLFICNNSNEAKKKIKQSGGLYFPANFHILIQRNNHE